MVIVGVVRVAVAEPGFCGAEKQCTDPRRQHDSGDPTKPFRWPVNLHAPLRRNITSSFVRNAPTVDGAFTVITNRAVP